MRPIGVGETLKRITGKAVGAATRIDVVETCGADQLCTGVKAGIKVAIHAINELFEDNKDSGWGGLLVDASNAFNSINRIGTLWNVHVMWPRCA